MSVRRLCDVEETQIEQAIKESLQSFAEHQESKKNYNFEVILTFYKNSGLLDKNWILVQEDPHIFFMLY